LPREESGAHGKPRPSSSLFLRQKWLAVIFVKRFKRRSEMRLSDGKIFSHRCAMPGTRDSEERR
jgi:hypothetical protein